MSLQLITSFLGSIGPGASVLARFGSKSSEHDKIWVRIPDKWGSWWKHHQLFINNWSARKLHFTFCSFFLTNTIMKHVEFSGNELLKPNTIHKKICYKHPYNSKKNSSSKTFKVTQTAVPSQHSPCTRLHEHTHTARPQWLQPRGLLPPLGWRHGGGSAPPAPTANHAALKATSTTQTPPPWPARGWTGRRPPPRSSSRHIWGRRSASAKGRSSGWAGGTPSPARWWSWICGSAGCNLPLSRCWRPTGTGGRSTPSSNDSLSNSTFPVSSQQENSCSNLIIADAKAQQTTGSPVHWPWSAHPPGSPPDPGENLCLGPPQLHQGGDTNTKMNETIVLWRTGFFFHWISHMTDQAQQDMTHKVEPTAQDRGHFISSHKILTLQVDDEGG